MKKSEAEQRVRYFIREWNPNWRLEKENLHFSDYWRWLKINDPGCTQFKSEMGAYHDAEIWFEQETGQNAWN